MPKQKLEFDLVARDVNATRAVDGLASSMDKAGDSAGNLSRQTSKVDEELKATRKSLLDLQRQFDQTGDLDLLGKIGRAQGKVTRLEKIRQNLDATAEEAGKSFGDKFIASAMAGLSSAVGGNPYATGVKAAFAVAAAPGIGAVVSSAVLGGAGLGGIIGGVTLAARDPRVQAAGTELGEQLMREFTRAAEPFVEPVLESLDKFGDAGWAAKLEPTFDKLATHVEPLTDGLIGFGDGVIRGFNTLADAAGPVLDTLTNHLPELGDAVDEAFTSIAENPEEAAAALDMLLDTVEDLIVTGGEFVGTLTDIYGGVLDVGHAIGLVDEQTKVWTKDTGDGADANHRFARSTDDAADSVDDLRNTLTTYLDMAFGLQEAQDQVANSWARLTEQIKEQKEEGDKGAGSLEGNTRAARDNREVMRGLADGYADVINETVMAGKSTDGLRAQFLAQAKQAGIAANQAKAYADQLFSIPDVVKTTLELRFRQIGGINSGGRGGAVFSGYSEGGLVEGPGTGTSDDIVAKVSNGEYVLKAEATRRIGVGALDHLNAGGSLASAGGQTAAAPAAGWGSVDAMEAAFTRALTRTLQAMPIMRMPDDAVRADHYYRGG